MNDEDQIGWVTLMLNFAPEQEARLLERAQAVGLSPKCYVVNLLLRHLLENAKAIQREQWQREFPATLRRNGCEESISA